jgi:hypothetical protein
MDQSADMTEYQDDSQQDESMTEDELITAIKNELSMSVGIEGSDLAEARIRATNYYFNRQRGDEVAGRSKVQSSDVMDVIEWVLPDIIEAFTTNDNAVEFQPIGSYDIEQAKIETQYINHIFYTEAGGYLTLYSFFKDALLVKNGIVKTYWEKRKKTQYDHYSGLTSMELQVILEGNEDYEIEPYEVNVEKKNLDDFPQSSWQNFFALPEVRDQITKIQQEIKNNLYLAGRKMGYNNLSYAPMPIQQQMQNQAQQIMMDALKEIEIDFYDVKVKMHTIQETAKCVPVAPEEFRVNSDHSSPNLEGARFTCHETMVTASELIELGIPREVVEELSAYHGTNNSEAMNRRFGQVTNPVNLTDDANKQIHFCDTWIMIDFDGDGVSELRHVWMANEDTILLNEYCDDHPFSSCSPIIVPHRWEGVSLHDRMKQIQDISTSIWRNILDNFYRANNNRTIVVENQVNMDDLLNPRPSGAVRARNVEAVKPFPYQPIGVEAFQILEGLSRIRMERSGVGPEMMAEGMVIDNDTAHGVERLMSAKEKLVGLIIKNLGEIGVADIFKKLHANVIKHQNKCKEIEINGRWLNIDPTKFRYREKVRVKVGLGAGDKIKHSSAVGKVLVNHQLLAETGMKGILFNYKSTYNALIDELRFAGVKQPEQYYLDPDSPEAQQQLEAMSKKAAEPSTEDKVIMLEAQIKQMEATLKKQKQTQDFVIQTDEQHRKWAADNQDTALGWAELALKKQEIKAKPKATSK